MKALQKAIRRTKLDPPTILIEFANQAELQRGYDELNALMGEVIPLATMNVQEAMHYRAVIAALASALKSGQLWNKQHERLMEDIGL